MRSTMQDAPLSITSILRHGTTVYGDSEVVTATESGRPRHTSYAEVGVRSAKLAHALRSLGITGDQRVATFAWNNQEHLEAYLTVPSMGAVLHTLNIRLFPEQLVYVANHAEDRIVIVDASLTTLLSRVLAEMTTVRTVLITGADADASALEGLGPQVLRYEDVLAAEQGSFDWPDVDERSAAAMCYTSGTTGQPKGVVYSHRSTWLHSAAACSGNGLGIRYTDRVLPIVPMFHANAWGNPYAALMSGAALVMPDRWLQADRLVSLIEAERPTVSAAVPTIWNDMLQYLRAEEGHDLSSLRLVACGGSAVPRALMESFENEFGVRIVQAWGMTETSPLAAVAHPPAGAAGEVAMDHRVMAGRVVCGVEARIVGEDGDVLPRDGKAVGELQVRGPWVTGAYHRDDDPAKFDGGWLRTGDVGRLDPQGFITLTDRSKDVIKSGGEWISSVELENAIMGHPDVVEAAVVGVPDEKWQERPLACVVVRSGVTLTAEELRDYLSERVAKWWLPERWAFIEAVPRTSVGKFDKKVLRGNYSDGALAVVRAER